MEFCKVRLVAEQFLQKYGEDLHEAFALVVKDNTIIMLVSVASSRKVEIKRLDVKTTFLHGEIAEQLYREEPPGFVIQKHLVYKLKKGLYGQKQAARALNAKLKKMLGFKQGDADQYFYCIPEAEMDI